MNEGREKFSMPTDDSVFHVVPINDIKPHSISFKLHIGLPIALCSCGPTLDAQAEYYGKNITVFIHNSFDGREGIEWAKASLVNAR